MREIYSPIKPPDFDDPESHIAVDPADINNDYVDGHYRYTEVQRHLRINHSGDRERNISQDREMQLAVSIQAGLAAQVELAESILTSEERQQKEQIVLEGQQAELVLVETHLRFARFMAMASYGVINPRNYRFDEISGEMIDAREDAAKMRSGKKKIGAYDDITKLKSKYAQIEDREQVAAMALVEAARKFMPAKVSVNPEKRTKKPAKFITYASWAIHRALERHLELEAPGPRLPTHIVEELKNVRKDRSSNIERGKSEYDGVNEERSIQLEAWKDQTSTLTLDQIMFPDAGSDEIWNDGDEPPVLGLNEVVASIDDLPVTEEVSREILLGKIEKMLNTLGEREAGIIRLRFGLMDDNQLTLDEIGAVYAVTRERIRQIETKTMSKVRHPTRSDELRDFVGSDIEAGLGYHAGDQILTGERRVGMGAGVPREKIITIPDKRELPKVRVPNSWQASTEDTWDAPVRHSPEVVRAEQEAAYKETKQKFDQLLMAVNPYTFQKTFADAAGTLYPKELFDRIQADFGKELTPQHLEQFWNENLRLFVDKLTEQVGDDVELDRIGQLFSMLLSTRMRDIDEVKLQIPEEFSGKIGFMGAWITNGTVTIEGDVGEYAGLQVSQIGTVIINGNTGDRTAAGLSKYGRVVVNGDVGSHVGYESRDNSFITINGSAGDCAGANMGGNAFLRIEGDVGDDCGIGLKKRGVIVEVAGAAGETVGYGAKDGEIYIEGGAKSHSIEGFMGVLTLGDRVYYNARPKVDPQPGNGS